MRKERPSTGRPFFVLRPGALLTRVVDGVVGIVLSGQDELRDGYEGVALL